MIAWGLGFLLLAGLVPVGAAWSHVSSTGLATLDVEGGRLAYRLTVVTSEVDPLGGEILWRAAGGDRQATGTVAGFLRAYARFSIGGEACAPGPIAVRGAGTGDGKVVLDMALSCPKASGPLVIVDDWPEVLGAHFQTVLSLRVAGRPSHEFVFVEDRRRATVDLAGADAAPSGFPGFVALGVEHIVGGIDHLLFLLALLAVVRSVWQTVKIVTAFTLAHSVTLSLAALGLVEVPSAIVEPLIAASIVWVALENLFAPQTVGRRWLVAALFGLVHGLGFASALTDLDLSRAAMVQALLGFNIGVELGQLAFVAVVLPPLAWASRPGRLARLPQALSAVVAVMGAVWLVERVVA
ncbi:HupE/UreJ family protein [Reyranella sp.]|uniref:HupE/UreJ family protein n=1 Tax=Reyranella sp. TaxID=1929291 RepID=UPI003BAB2DB8